MWTIQPIPAAGGVPRPVSAALAAVSCPAAGDCVAVGSLPTSGGTTVLVDAYNGVRWKPQPAPSPGGTAAGDYSALTGISCTSASSCEAVGTFTAGSAGRASFAESWNGAKWSVQRTPAAGTLQLNAVSCTSATACVAVGSLSVGTSTTPVAEVYDGRAWTADPIAIPPTASAGQLDAVSCTTTCQAVGSYTGADGGAEPLVAAFDGASWREAALPVPQGAVPFEGIGGLDGISCASATACVAVGSYSTSTQTEVPYSEVMSGTAWAIAPVPFDMTPTAPSKSLTAVSCTTATACTAAGTVGRALLVDRWDGTGWAAAPTAPPPRGSYVDATGGVACVAASCIAVGSDAVGNPYVHTDFAFAEATTGGGWSLRSPPLRAVTASSELDAVSCSSTTACTAVGDARPGGGNGMRPLAERWDGRRWQIQPVAPSGRLHGVELGAVSCPAANWCMAAGSLNFASNTTAQSALALRWDGRTWSRAGTPLGSILDAVSCTRPDACVAVGPDAVAETWNGRRWSELSLPGIRGLSPSYTDVSCYAAGSCMIVGEAIGFCAPHGGRCNVHDVVVDERLIGGRWTLQRPPQSYGALALVACPALARCIAAGVVAEVYDGRHWSVERLPRSAGLVLSGLSCPTAQACTAVGSRANDPAPVAEAWNGSVWTALALPAPLGGGPSSSTVLNGISCPNPAFCVAVGSHAGASGRSAPFAELGRLV